MTQSDFATDIQEIFKIIEVHGWDNFNHHLPENLAHIQSKDAVFEALKNYTIQCLHHHSNLNDLKAYDMHDRLLELFMMHIDSIHPFKKCLVQLPFNNMIQLCKNLKPLLDTIEGLAGISHPNIISLLKSPGLMGVYVYGIYYWMDDQTPDQSATLAAFDKALRWGENLLGKINF